MNRRVIGAFLYFGLLLFAAIEGLSQPLKLTRVGTYGSLGGGNSLSLQYPVAYVANGGGGLEVINIANPAWPFLTATCGGLGYTNHVQAVGGYAYVTNGEGLNIVDVSDPEKPKLAVYYPTPGRAQSVFVTGNHAHIACGLAGILILDVTNPAQPVFEASFDTPGDARGVFVTDHIAYVADGASGIQILAVFNPVSPFLIGSQNTAGAALDILVQGSYAYVTEGASGIQIFDIGDPSSPQVVGSWSGKTQEGNPMKCAHIEAKNGYAFISSEDYSQGMQILNIADPYAPVRVYGGYGGSGPLDVRVEGPYAYGVAGGSFWIEDISNPANPVYAGRVMTFPNSGDIGEITVKGKYLYSCLGPKFQIIDISDASSPKYVGFYSVPQESPAPEKWISRAFVNGDIAYLMVNRASFGGMTGTWSYLQIFDISNRTSPRLLSSTELVGRATFFVDGSRAYISSSNMASHWSTWFGVYDVSNPTSPIKIDVTGGPGGAEHLFVSGNLLYSGYGSVSIFDISNLASIRYLGSCPCPDPSHDDYYGSDFMVVGHTCYIVLGKEGLVIFDISDPTTPIKVGSYPTLGLASSVCVSGNYAYVADRANGLVVVDVSNPYVPTLAASLEITGYTDHVLADNGYIYLSHGGVLDIFRAERESDLPRISVRPSRLVFGASRSGGTTLPQTISVAKEGKAASAWSITKSTPWLKCSPSFGKGQGTFAVSVETADLPPGTYAAEISIVDGYASNSPLTTPVTLNVYDEWASGLPFGSFDAPLDGTAGVTGAIPVTGWVLDDIEATRAAIERDPVLGDPPGASGPDGLIYIGDAIFVEGARPDVEAIYSQFPLSSRGGWGYMLLTNMLPNKGNGTYKLYAYASDKEGHRVLLGTRTITCDNAHAVKPFGAIDSPAQGGTASGNLYINFGWVLTPLPKTIPKDGSTISVWVDGALSGALDTPPNVYDQYRVDVSKAFPDLNNSSGPVGAFYLDTTKYANGVHTIQWVATDDAGAADGIGSRYFNIVNSESASEIKAASSSKIVESFQKMSPGKPFDAVTSHIDSMALLPVSFDPIGVKRGFNLAAPAQTVIPDNFGLIQISIREVDRIELDLGKGTNIRGCLLVGDELRPLPIGSTLDPQKSTFAWMPGPGFLGIYDLVFLKKDEFGVSKRIPVQITIKPKFSLNR